MVRYQRPFIQDFTKIARPLTDLTKKNPTFKWTTEATEAIKALKKAITSEPVLVPLDPYWQFELEMDTSLFTTGAILYQRELHPDDTTNAEGFPINKGKWHAISYHSGTFSLAKWNYPIYDYEYLGIIRGLQHWSYLLKNTLLKLPVLVITDHVNLQYYRDPRKLPAQVHSWNAKQADYNIKMIYKSGTQNHVDSLSWQPDHIAGMKENFDVQTFLDEMFSLDTLEHAIQAISTGWTGVTGEEILCGQGLESMNTTKLDYQTIKSQVTNESTLNRWITAHGLQEWGSCYWKDTALIIMGDNDLKSGKCYFWTWSV